MSQVIRSAKQLGAFIHNARVERHLTQQSLANLVGTGQKTISRIENGHEGTKLETIFSLIAALDLDINLVPRTRGSKDLGEIF